MSQLTSLRRESQTNSTRLYCRNKNCSRTNRTSSATADRQAPKELLVKSIARKNESYLHTMLAALLLALPVALALAYFAKSVLVRTPSKSPENTAYGSASGLSLDEQRKYQDQLLRKRNTSSTQPSQPAQTSEPKPVMQPAKDDLAPPKDDPFTLEQLKAFDGSDPSKPIYVAIKCSFVIFYHRPRPTQAAQSFTCPSLTPSAGTVFDVTRKADTYGSGKSYNIFAGKDASRALGMSSLKPEDAVSDYSTLSEGDMKTLNDWFDFFSYVLLPCHRRPYLTLARNRKRYNIVGKVIDLPAPQSSASAPSAL